MYPLMNDKQYGVSRKELHRQSELFKALIEHSSDVIIISDAQGIERYVSPSVSRVLGYEPEDFLSRSQYLLHHPSDRDRVRDTFFYFVNQCCTKPLPMVFSWRFLHKNGTWRWVEATASNQLDNPLVQGIILNIRDITEHKEMEESLRRAIDKSEKNARAIEQSSLEIKLKNQELKKLNEEKNDLLQIVSHDLKNPLYNIQHQAGAILDNTGNVTAHTRNILACADKMLGLIKNFLNIHAIESGKVLLHWQPVDLTKKVEKVLKAYEDTLASKGISVKTKTHNVLTPAWTDPDAVYQVLDNLISNAIKYSPLGGTISIDIGLADGLLTTRIQDEGAGVPLDEVDKLFQKFTRLSTRPTAGESSNGLGLAIAKKLTKQLKGDIWYEHYPGQGATFAFELPIYTFEKP
jgi:PAS domain S-box-containing protein